MKIRNMNCIVKALVVAIISASLIGLAACGKKEAKAEAQNEHARAVAVRVTTAEQRSIAEELALTGTLKPKAQVQVVSEVAARLVQLVKDEGQYVAKGEVIAVLDSTDFRLSHERAQAAVAVAEANREHALTERERANTLLKTGGITEQDHLAAQVKLQVAEASLRQTKAEAALAGQNLARTRIRAPFSGRVTKRLVDQGTMLAAGTAVVELVDNSVLEFRASVPSADFAKVRENASLVITVDSMPGFQTQGRVERILPKVDERSRSFEVVARVTEKTNLVSGMFARARLKVRELPNALVVPPTAVLHDGTEAQSASLFVVENGKAELKQVALGYEGLDAVEVKQGLTPGATVVVDPPTTLASGAPVQVPNSANRTAER